MTERRLKYLYEHFMNVIQRLSILGHHGVIEIGYYYYYYYYYYHHHHLR